jgi:uncharacterized protein
MPQKNPCITCGACCAHFRVSFHWSEADPAQDGIVPTELTQDVNQFRRCMKGTDQRQPRCIALTGKIGGETICTIYENRPSPCRDFGVQWTPEALYIVEEDLERCSRARETWGLPPISHDPENVIIFIKLSSQ